MNWLQKLVNEHLEFESPLSFTYWGALAAISATVKDQIWLPRYLYNLYPNIYVMFHAASGLKKGPAVSMARQLVETVNNTKIISGRSSIQGILKEMGTANTIPGGKIVGGSNAFICSSELTSSIVDDPVAVKILTDLYDRNYNVGTWRSLLKMESFSLKNPTITMLTATNEAMSDDFFNKTAIQGGYFARTFIIYEEKRNKVNSLVIPPEHVPDYKQSSAYLKTLSGLKGAFVPLGSRIETDYHKMRVSGNDYYFTDAGAAYEEWYNQFVAYADISEDETGTTNRFGDSVLKVAILLSLAEKAELNISHSAMIEAIEITKRLIGNVRKTTQGKTGLSLSAALKAKIIEELLSRDPPQISRDMLMRKFWMHYAGIDEVDDMLGGLEQAEIIKINLVAGRALITMTEKYARDMKDRMKGEKI